MGPRSCCCMASPVPATCSGDLIPLLADRFHIVAPDLPGFGQSDMPDHTKFQYSFDTIAKVIERFTEVIGLKKFAVYVFDYGAPTGFRLAVRHPERITAIITQNGNAYEEGLSGGWAPIQKYWKDPSKENRDALRSVLLSPEATIWQYTHGVPDATTGFAGRICAGQFLIWRGRGWTRSSSISSATIKAMSRSIPPSRNISATTSLRPCGGVGQTRSLLPAALCGSFSSATIPMRW